MDAGKSIEQKYDLVLLYHSGELEGEERLQAEQWLAEDAELQIFHEDLEKQSKFLNAGNTTCSFEGMEKEVLNALRSEEMEEASASSRWMVAAAMLAFLVAGVMYQMSKSNKTPKVADVLALEEKAAGLKFEKFVPNHFKKKSRTARVAVTKDSANKILSKQRSSKVLVRWLEKKKKTKI